MNPGYFNSKTNKESEMKRKEWKKVVKASKNKEYQKAIDYLNNILAYKIDDQERVIVLVNIAQCEKKLNKIEEAVSFFDRAIDIENKTNAFFALMHKAVFLYEIGKPQESLDIYNKVKAYPNLTAEDREAISINVDLIRERRSI